MVNLDSLTYELQGIKVLEEKVNNLLTSGKNIVKSIADRLNEILKAKLITIKEIISSDTKIIINYLNLRIFIRITYNLNPLPSQGNAYLEFGFIERDELNNYDEYKCLKSYLIQNQINQINSQVKIEEVPLKDFIDKRLIPTIYNLLKEKLSESDNNKFLFE